MINISNQNAKLASKSGKPKGKPRGKPFRPGKGPDRDPRITGLGRPANGQSWSEQFQQVGEMTPEQVVEIVGNDNELGQLYASLPKNIQLKTLIAMSSVGDAISNPNQARVLKEVLDRLEGKAKDGNQKSGTSQTSFLPSLPAELLAPSFLESWRAIKSGDWTEFIEKGGRGSTKSTFISLCIIWLIVNNPTFHALVMRQVADTLRQSVYAQLKWAINKLGLTDSFKCTVNPLEIEYIPTGQKIFMRGADDPFKIKSITPEFGSIAILWFEEIQQFHGEDAIRDITQSAIRGENSDVAYIFKSYNPPRTQRNWINKYVLIPKENQYQHSSTYLDVPKQWLGKVFFDEAEHLKKVNPSAYANEYLGEITGLGDSVFENLDIREITDDEIKTFETIEDGLDFGYSPHPAHYSKTYYDADSTILYIFGEVRKWKASNREMYDAIVEEGGYENSRLLICDSAENKSVADYQSYGSYARGAEKGGDSVSYSMRWLQTRVKIVIDPVRCPYSATEFAEYAYERTKGGEIIESFPKEKDDAIAATRYAQNLRWRIGGE